MYTSVGVASMPGTVNTRTSAIANGAAAHSTQGRALPQRVDVRSTIAPMPTSTTPSNSRAMSTIVPTADAAAPITLV